MSTEMGEKGHEEEVQGARIPPESSNGGSQLRQAVLLISSLISLCHSIKVFPVKWQLIRNKLGELNSALTADENCDWSENPEFLELIPAIRLTLDECHDLARRCVDLSYSGKLLMQSDLDVIAAKLERHIKNLAGIYNSGILVHAIVVSKPSVGARRDDVKFYIRDLLTRLKIGDSKMKGQALAALSEVVEEDEKNVKIIVDMGEVISLLVNFLEVPEMGIQEESVKVLSVFARFDSYKGALVGAGIIAPLIRVLESGSGPGKERAARTLMKLTENSDNAWSISAQGGVTALLKICSNSDRSSGPISAACGVLKNLVRVEEIKRFMVEEGAISAFISLMGSNDEALQINSIELLQVMASGDSFIQQIVIREGGIRWLVCMLDPKFSFSSKVRENALRAIESFCFSSTKSIKILVGYGFLEHLLFFLCHGEVSVQELAVKASYHLCGSIDETKKAMGDAGYITELMNLLHAKSFEVREMAAEALSSMVSVSRNRRRFLNEDCNVNYILQILDPEEGKSANKKFLFSILMSLTSCYNGRAKIVNSRYVKNLEKLAEAGVTDAQRIVRKLSRNRILNILTGFGTHEFKFCSI